MPRRRCVGCGRVAPKSQLLRIAADDGAGGERPCAVIDALARMPGRGAYLCRSDAVERERPRPDEACLAQAHKRRAIARALRRPIAADSFSDDLKLVESTSP